MMNVKLLSENTVILVGIGVPFSMSPVAANGTRFLSLPGGASIKVTPRIFTSMGVCAYA